MIAPDPLDELDRLLSDPDLPDEVMLLSQLDGLIAAVLVAPGLADQDWLPLAWGGGEAPFEPAALDRLRSLASARKAQVVGELLRGGTTYEPVYEIDTDDEPLWQIWMEGFAAGAARAGEPWAALADHPDEDLGAAALGLAMLIVAAEQRRPARELTAEAPGLIPHLVETLYRRQRNLARVALDEPPPLPLLR